jgi:hypothetical protein
MEDALGVKQRKIGQAVVNSNLNQEMMGKESVLCDDGTVRYPMSISYDMEWQKSKKTYDSLLGHGLMIGLQTNVSKNILSLVESVRDTQKRLQEIRHQRHP